MSARRRRGVCAYCGKDKNLTDDHVPPKVLLAQPYPANLPTVPACYDCNRSFQKDDDYTASVLSRDVRAMGNPIAQTRLDAVTRALARPDAAGFAAYLQRQSVPTQVLGVDGRPWGTMLDVDRRRVDNTGEHIARGLFYYDAKTPVSPTATVRVGGKPGLPKKDESVIHFAKMYATWPERRSGTVGDGFSYVAVLSGTGHSIWFLMLYEYFFWLAVITEEGGATGQERKSPSGATIV
jgi:hypothetical protein